MVDKRHDAYCVYSVIACDGQHDRWLKIGLAIPHPDRQGFNVMLEALPLNAKLVLRKLAAEEEHEDTPLSLAQQVDAFERALIERCLMETGGKISAVLERLEVPRRTLNEKMARLGINRQRLISIDRRDAADAVAAISEK
jgi:DNA-binding NtrC family response regulator